MNLSIKQLLLGFTLFSVLTSSDLIAETDQSVIDSGKKVYDFYCYQCHSYRGDARTLATTFLNPPPRDFTRRDADTLTYDAMISAVTHGKAGTGMVSFASEIDKNEIHAVITYIREKLMQGDNASLIYHTKENGWPDHARYKVAFPFAAGTLPLDTPWDELSTEQQAGKRLFMRSCISCHDRAVVKEEGAIWQSRPLSYPRKHFSNRVEVDIISGASPYAVHEVPPDTSNFNPQQKRGAQLFYDNCAFCHGADGTGKNWIGMFMEPKARDLTGNDIKQRPDKALRVMIENGLDNTSMPAWKHVLSEDNIDDIIAFIKH